MKLSWHPTPDFLDLAGWQRALDWLRAQPDDLIGRDGGIELAEQMVEILSEPTPENPAPQAA